jgi:hypothetical protein
VSTDKPKVLIFVNSGPVLDPLFRRLSVVLKEAIAIGLVFEGEHGFSRRFGITTFPAIVGLTGEEKGVRY